jgi:hypothetical protein
MAKTITLNNVKIVGMFVDIVNQKVVVTFTTHDSTGKQWGGSQTETYWVTLPATPGSSDVQLPAQYLANLVSLYNAASAAILTKYA